jgi:hypothetical protein
MDLMTAAFLCMAITTVGVTLLMAVRGVVARAKSRHGTSRKHPRPEFREQATRVAGVPHSGRRIRPQQRPAAARARTFRGRTTYVVVATTQRRGSLGQGALPSRTH